jgi:PAS domain-containing protein
MWVKLGLTLAAVGTAAAARALLYHVIGSGLPFLTFFPAIIVASLYGGLGAGLSATALSALASTYWMEPAGSFHVLRPADWIGLGLFIVTGLLIVWVCERATRARRQANEAVLEQQRLAAIVASSDDAIISKDLNGTIQSWNAAAERLFGYSADEMVGQSITRLLPADRINEEGEILARIRRNEKVDHYVVRLSLPHTPG